MRIVRQAIFAIGIIILIAKIQAQKQSTHQQQEIKGVHHALRGIQTNADILADGDVEIVEWKVTDSYYKRALQQCPTQDEMLSNVFGDDGVSGPISSWFEDAPGGKSFVKALIDTYIDSDLSVDTGGSIKDGNAPFTSVCSKLPLLHDTCYLGSTKDHLLRSLVAKFVPFGDQIVGAVETVEGFLGEIEDATAEEVEAFYNPEETGSCAVLNDDMFGIYETPGFPQPFIYEFCNCWSMFKTGTPACTVQPFFRGIAISTGGSDSLNFNSPDKLEFYDGNIQYELQNISGDAWLAFGIDIGVPKLASLVPSNLVCVPLGGHEKPDKPDGPPFNVEIAGSLFVSNDLDNTDEGGELLILGVLDEIRIKFKGVVNIDLGTLNAALRIRASNPACFPSGMFFSANIKPVVTFGIKVSPILSFNVDPDEELEVFGGVSWLDRGDVKPEEYIQSFFYKETRSMVFLGIPFTTILEFQYFDEKEFTRRKNFNSEECCPPGGDFVNCDVPDTGLAKIINDSDTQFTAQPTFAIFAQMQDMNFHEIVFIRNIELMIIVQLPGNREDVSLLVKFASNVEVMGILEVKTEVIFTISEDRAFASFFGVTSIDAGEVLGEATLTVYAEAAIGNYLNDVRRGRTIESSALASTNTGNESRDLAVANLLGADWDLDIDVAYHPPQWAEEVAKEIAGAAKDVANAIENTWNDVSKFVEDTFNDVIDLAQQLGEELSEIFTRVADAIGEGGDLVENAVDAAAEFFGDNDMGAIEDLLGGLGDVAGLAFDIAEESFEFGANILSGDFDKVADSFVTSLDFVDSEPSAVMGSLGCLKIKKIYEKCYALGIYCDKEIHEVQDITCIIQKTVILQAAKTKAMDAKQKQECRDRSKMRNQGLSYVHATDLGILAEQITPQLSFETIQLGTTSEISTGTTTCKELQYTLSVNTLSPQDPNGFSGGMKGSDRTTTSDCFEFKSVDDFENTLGRLNSDREIASKIGEKLVLGDQGLDNDVELQECLNSINGVDNCQALEIGEGTNFNSEATISCNEAQNPNFKALFGEITIGKDPRCTEPAEQSFFIIGGSPPEFACGARMLTIERSVKDCCGNTVDMTHLLHIAQVAPTVTQLQGSLDATRTCDANIHPSKFGNPSFDGGCTAANHNIDMDQADPVFDLSTCTTTLLRTFKVTENGCNAQSQLFEQTITLENNYDPQFDSFPPDKTIGVFDSYGTEALGFPTAFQQCGLPVNISYLDEISEGRCFAERVLKRTFKAVDSCGHVTEQSQVITITNAAGSLPLGGKSLASIYGHSKMNVEDDTKSSRSCILPSDKCGIYGAPKYKCAKSSKTSKKADRFVSIREEFSPYQSRLTLLPEKHLIKGVTSMACACTEGDVSCDKRTEVMDPSDAIYFGTAVTTASGTCNALTVATRDEAGMVTVEEVDCPIIKKSIKSSKTKQVATPCLKMMLSGSNPFYNIFEITANDFHDKTIFIDTPPTSVVLVNVVVLEEDIGKKIYFGHRKSSGVILSEGIVAHNILWNIVDEIDLNLQTTPKHENWAFHGTVLIPYGEMKLKSNKNYPAVWKGQIFAYSVDTHRFDEFECGGHFAGFASCENLIQI